jgi:hypothetical protein
MSRAGFYSDNEFRNYPFVVNSEAAFQFPTEVIVDFGCIMGIEAGFDYTKHKVWLYQISKISQTFRFEFKCDAPGLVGRSLIFDFNESDPEYTTRFTSDDLSSGISSSWTSSAVLTCNDYPKWEGYLVIGKLLYALLSFVSEGSLPEKVITWKTIVDGIYWSGNSFLLFEHPDYTEGGSSAEDLDGVSNYIEPALIQNLGGVKISSGNVIETPLGDVSGSGGYVRKIGLANSDRTRHTLPDVCYSSSSLSGSSISAPSSTSSATIIPITFVDTGCTQDSEWSTGRGKTASGIKVKPGYNAEIIVSETDNSITLKGDVGGGEGEPCSEVPLHTSESPLDCSNILSGGPQCKETIKTINGIGGRVVRVKGGLGVTVEPGLAPNTIVVKPDHAGMTLCGNVLASSIGG